MQLIKTMKNLSKVSQIYKDDIQLKISKIYGSVNPQVNTYYYSRKIKDLIKDFNQSNKLARKEDICSEKTILLISYLGKMNTWFRSKEKETELAGAGKNSPINLL